MDRYERLNNRLIGLNLLYGKVSINATHNSILFYIVEHTEDVQFIRKEAMQIASQTGIDEVYLYGEKESLWHQIFDETDIQIKGESEDILLTCSYITIDDLINELIEVSTTYTFVPLDCYLIYDDRNIYEDIKKRLRDKNLFED